MNQSLNDIVIFQSEDGTTHLTIKLEKESIWLSQKQMSELFEKGTDTIGLHSKIFMNPENLPKNELPRITR